jgi:hypothetical protein
LRLFSIWIATTEKNKVMGHVGLKNNFESAGEGQQQITRQGLTSSIQVGGVRQKKI